MAVSSPLRTARSQRRLDATRRSVAALDLHAVAFDVGVALFDLHVVAFAVGVALFDLHVVAFAVGVALFDLHVVALDVGAALFDVHVIAFDVGVAPFALRVVAFELRVVAFDLWSVTFDRGSVIFDLQCVAFDARGHTRQETPMRIVLTAVAVLFVVGTSGADAQTSPEPFKVGTFQQGTRPFVGIVLRESIVIDLNSAHTAVRTPASTLGFIDGMKDLISRYDTGVRARIVELIRAAGDVSSANRPAWVHNLSALRILPPIMYPTTMLNVAVNYAEHDIEMARGRAPGQAPPTAGRALPNTSSAPGIWERAADDWRWNPYMFMKSPGVIVADGADVKIPVGRTLIEWECELGVVIGKATDRPGVARAGDFIFGYTLENDMSDRGGRGDTRSGSDWVVSKNHDTFAPMGPFITPKEFIADVGRLKMTFVLNGEVLQTGTTAQMIHNVFEQVAYASNIMTLRPGDVLATGTPPGVGSARTPPILLKAGDKMSCSYEGVGILSNPVVATAGR